MDNPIDEDVKEASAFYKLSTLDEDYVSVTETAIFDEKVYKGIHSLKFNYNDQYLAAGYRDGRVRIFNTKTKNLTCTLDCNPIPNETLVQTLKWRPKIEGRTNNILMTACRDTLLEWHTPSRKVVNSMCFNDKSIYSIEYSNDGLQYAVGLADCSIRIFDGVTRKEEIALGGKDNLKVVGHMNKIYALRYHKDNPKILISGGWDDNVLFWDLNSGNTIKVIVGPHIYGEGLDINCFGEILTASWRKDNPLEIFDYETGNRKMSVDWNFKEENTKSSTQLYCCKFSKDFGKLIFAGGSQVNSVKIFDWNGTGVATIDKLSHACLALDSSNDVAKNEQLLAIGGGEGIVRMFKLKYGANFR